MRPIERPSRQVRQDAAAKNVTTFLVGVEEYGGFWTLTVPDIPGIRVDLSLVFG
jgi:hypothetical protein